MVLLARIWDSTCFGGSLDQLSLSFSLDYIEFTIWPIHSYALQKKFSLSSGDSSSNFFSLILNSGIESVVLISRGRLFHTFAALTRYDLFPMRVLLRSILIILEFFDLVSFLLLGAQDSDIQWTVSRSAGAEKCRYCMSGRGEAAGYSSLQEVSLGILRD